MLIIPKIKDKERHQIFVGFVMISWGMEIN